LPISISKALLSISKIDDRCFRPFGVLPSNILQEALQAEKDCSSLQTTSIKFMTGKFAYEEIALMPVFLQALNGY
jgi:hypothetical protein